MNMQFALTPDPETERMVAEDRVTALMSERDGVLFTREESTLIRKDAYDLVRAWREIRAGDVEYGLRRFESVMDDLWPDWRSLA